ncbi:hypothetical protein [Ferruginibacter albus]|uniref:hypothetical protein n=1 Tax=Ferruginibacter albus TaxID=2875540 RepID=UPI001CC46179|nr:hypothetical protein [Ferruginibacter albus]UAY52094.1 hypothetical protein K9M53_00015 [Ferruginibacter albus]
MPKDSIPSVIPNRTASIIYGITIILTGIYYFYYSRQISPSLPKFFRHSFIVYTIGICFFFAGFSIVFDLLITKISGYLLALLLFCLAVTIELRGLLNSAEELKYIYAQGFIRDLGLSACGIIVSNFKRGQIYERKHNRRRSKPVQPLS